MQTQMLFDTAQRIFEEAAFALVDPPEEAPDSGTAPGMYASVDFFGPMSGILTIAASERLARTFAANMLGVDEDDPDALAKPGDALGEILNMICGNLLPAIAGAGPEFRIDAPQELSSEGFRLLVGEHEPELSTTVKMCVEGCETELALLLDSEARPG